MQTSSPVVDIHIHPTMKPYGNSYYSNSNRDSVRDMACIWRQDKYTYTDELVENLVGVARYRQSDFTTLVNGQIKLACVALYPVETGFFEIRQKELRPYEVFIAQFASLLGKERISFVLGKTSVPYDYFKDLCDEYEYLKCLNGRPASGGALTYDLISDAKGLNRKSNLLIIPTIEGGHSFCNGHGDAVLEPTSWVSMDHNVRLVKQWEAPPLFITLAHHFYNGLCTHAKSLFEISGELLDQTYGMRDYDVKPTDGLPPISLTGMTLIRLLLSRENGRRVFIDVKHMSLEARCAYYELLKNEYHGENIPIVWSHGGVSLDKNHFYFHEINLHLSVDVYAIYKTNGLIGVEMDQRILGYNNYRIWKWLSDWFISKGRQAYKEAYYFWEQIITIAEYAFQNEFTDPWKCICLGSDYDGLINPLNAYRDEETMPVLYRCLVKYLLDYWETPNRVIPKNHGGWDAHDVIYRIMYRNAIDFISKNYVT